MKLICAGYPKTGSKSCSSALRELGYNVADYMETLEFLSTDWRNYIRGTATIEDVLKAYDREGFDTNQVRKALLFKFFSGYIWKKNREKVKGVGHETE